ncbi:MAG TPA: hypothetical protein VE173_09465, partial [Longimicrobiales bacterium]|nr:hypothetical protein [Longimicrobiales bacterium]
LAEARDVDRLGVGGDRGRLVLDIRNEAMETHYINHLEMLEVSHSGDETVVPDASGLPLAVSGWSVPLEVRDRDGRDVRELVVQRDSLAFATAPSRLAATTPEDYEDHLVLNVPAPAADSAAVVLRMRNSLLNTVLLYDFMLGRAGLQAVDWLGGSLERLGTMVEMGVWYRSRMGMRVEVREGGMFRPVGRVGDAGPLAWKDVAVMVPVPPGEERLLVRLSFVADQWRIDRIRVAGTTRRPGFRVVPPARVLDRDGLDLPEAREALASPDEDYLRTLPGDVVQAVFEVGPASGPRTFMLAAQGYYTEWIRPDWIRTAEVPEPFVPSDTVLAAALERWRSVKLEMESAFFAARVPTR